MKSCRFVSKISKNCSVRVWLCLFVLSKSVYSKIPKGFCSVGSVNARRALINMLLKLSLTMYFSQSFLSEKDVSQYWWWLIRLYHMSHLLPLAVVCRLSSIGPVLRHVDRQVRPPEEGTGCFRWLHPVLYCTTGNRFTLNQNRLYIIRLIHLFFLHVCTYMSIGHHLV